VRLNCHPSVGTGGTGGRRIEQHEVVDVLAGAPVADPRVRRQDDPLAGAAVRQALEDRQVVGIEVRPAAAAVLGDERRVEVRAGQQLDDVGHRAGRPGRPLGALPHGDLPRRQPDAVVEILPRLSLVLGVGGRRDRGSSQAAVQGRKVDPELVEPGDEIDAVDSPEDEPIIGIREDDLVVEQVHFEEAEHHGSVLERDRADVLAVTCEVAEDPHPWYLQQRLSATMVARERAMADVFLSYSRDDTERVAPLADALREAGRMAGFAVWWDPMMLPGTTDFDQYLQERLDAAKCVVVVWSSTSVQSHYVKAEAEEGRARGILTPVLIDRVKLPLSFRFVQTADLSDWRPGRPSAEFDRLVTAITERVRGRTREEAPRPPPLPQSAWVPPGGSPAGRAEPPEAAVAPGPVRRAEEGAPQAGASLDVIGAERWSARVTGAIRSAPALGPEGDVYVVTEAGALQALGPDGRMRWSVVVGGAGHFSAPSVTVAPGGRVHVVFDRYLYAFDAGGSLSWKWTAPGGVTATPAFDDSGRVFAMTNNSELWAVSEQASELWRRKLCGVTGGGTWPGPACNGHGLVYAVCKGSEIYGVEAEGGELAWSVPTNDRMESTPVVGADGAGYFASTGGWVFAINPDGSPRWLASVAPPPGKIAMVDAPLAIADDGSIIVAPRHGSLYALSADGEVKWDVPIGGQGTGGRPVAVSPNGTVYATTTNGELVAVGPDGTARARVRPGEAPSAPAVGTDGVLYVGVGSTLHAVEPAG